MKNIYAGICLFFCFVVSAQLPGAEKFAKLITAETLKEHLYIYASDEFEGRETGSEGQKKAVNYLRGFYIKHKMFLPIKTHLLLIKLLLRAKLNKTITKRGLSM